MSSSDCVPISLGGCFLVPHKHEFWIIFSKSCSVAFWCRFFKNKNSLSRPWGDKLQFLFFICSSRIVLYSHQLSCKPGYFIRDWFYNIKEVKFLVAARSLISFWRCVCLKMIKGQNAQFKRFCPLILTLFTQIENVS
jgi:hypothetical protein